MLSCLTCRKGGRLFLFSQSGKESVFTPAGNNGSLRGRNGFCHVSNGWSQSRKSCGFLFKIVVKEGKAT